MEEIDNPSLNTKVPFVVVIGVMIGIFNSSLFGALLSAWFGRPYYEQPIARILGGAFGLGVGIVIGTVICLIIGYWTKKGHDNINIFSLWIIAGAIIFLLVISLGIFSLLLLILFVIASIITIIIQIIFAKSTSIPYKSALLGVATISSVNVIYATIIVFDLNWGYWGELDRFLDINPYGFTLSMAAGIPVFMVYRKLSFFRIQPVDTLTTEQSE